MKILFTGDLAPILNVEKWMVKGNSDEVLSRLRTLFQAHDEIVVNLECPLTEVDASRTKTGPSLKSHPQVASSLARAGITVASLANNHIMDFGELGLSDTQLALSANGISTVGAGVSIAEAKKPCILKYGSHQIAILSYAEHEYSIAGQDYPGINPINPLQNAIELKEVVAENEFVFVIVHGGHEYRNLPSPYFVDLLRFYASFGVTAVISHHTHCSSVIEECRGVPIFYGLGNFIFPWNNTREDEWYNGLLVSFNLTSDKVMYDIYTIKQDREGCISDFENVSVDSYNNALNFDPQVLLSESYRKEYLEYLKEKGRLSVNNLLFGNKILKKISKRGLLPKSWFWSVSNKLNFFHAFHSEGYLEAIREYLKNEYRNINK